MELTSDMSLEQVLVRPNAANSRLGGCELALCRGSRGVGFFLDIDRNAVVFQTSVSQCLAIGLVVRGGLWFLGLLAARLAAAENDHHPECVGPAATGDWSAQVEPAQRDTTINRSSGNSQ